MDLLNAVAKPLRHGGGHTLLGAIMIGGALLLLALIPIIKTPFERVDYYGRVATRPAPEFLLHDTNGSEVRIVDFRGRFVYLMFGYLNCDRVCHSQALTLHLLSRRIRDERVRFLYLDMDPERDQPQSIRQYFDARADNFVGLVANSLAEAQSVAADYRAYFNTEPGPGELGYRIAHPGYIYLIDPNGDIRLIYSGPHLNDARMLDDLKHLFEEFN